jgi:hypothetical protein
MSAIDQRIVEEGEQRFGLGRRGFGARRIGLDSLRSFAGRLPARPMLSPHRIDCVRLASAR